MMIVTPDAAGGEKVGHFGFFRSRFSDSLWPPIGEWLRTDNIPAELQGRPRTRTARETV
jgi:hypothetical protein